LFMAWLNKPVKELIMRFFVVLAAMCALTQIATAQTPECKSISDSAARLACFDKKAVPEAPSAAAKPASPRNSASEASPAKYVDTIAAEDKLMNARLKNICRGC
jgi:hypothetical protein